MLYKYEATTPQGESKTGTIEAANRDIAISVLQARNLIITSIESAEKGGFLSKEMAFFNRIKTRDIVILARQLSTLFEAKVSVLISLRLLATETENPILREKLTKLLEDVQGGSSISEAMSKQSDVFSKFFVSMVRSGEESGKLDEVFSYLATYLERNHELTSKAKSAMVYPIFVIIAFIAVMVLMMVVVIPKMSTILQETGQELPVYTKIILETSDFIRDFGLFVLLALLVGIVGFWYYIRTPKGKIIFSKFKISVPYIGDLFKKFYLSRIMDNFETLLSAGISVVRTIELTADVVGDEIYRQILEDTVNAVKGGSSISESLARYEYVPGIVIQMIRVGEETGKLSFVLQSLSRFYKREVDTATETLMSLIEPVLIIVLGGGVGLLIAGVLGPIYGISAGI